MWNSIVEIKSYFDDNRVSFKNIYDFYHTLFTNSNDYIYSVPFAYHNYSINITKYARVLFFFFVQRLHEEFVDVYDDVIVVVIFPYRSP